MKIAVDCRMYGMSGIGCYLRNLLQNLPQNHQYLLIGKKKLLEQYVHEKIIECDIPIFSIRELLGFSLSEINRCDVFFCPNWNIPGGIKIPVYCVIHDVVFFDVPNIVSEMKKLLYYVWMHQSVRKSAHIFTVSDFTAGRIQQIFRIPQEKISVTYADIQREIKEYSKTGIKATKNYFVYVGNIKKHKGLKTLVTAFNKLDSTDTLYIIGKSNGLKTSDKMMGYDNDRVIFTGCLSDDQVYYLIYNAKALIQPSLYEGFGLPPLEALWLTTPVIMSDIPVFREIYGELPVTFFEAGNSDELAEKMRHVVSFQYKPDQILRKYDAHRVAETVFRTILDQRSGNKIIP